MSRAAPSIFINPYAGHRMLSGKEQEVLGEYARLAATIKRITALSLSLSSSERHASLLSHLRILERKMGLVLTLFKASVWSLIQTHQDEMEEQEQQQQQEEEGMTGEDNTYPDDEDGTITRQEYAY
ncbi:hypothetical protein CBS101457_000533 [Exobasidium rhododendri]|nr:hypothetical protein CBS101457_000533 [Exobasidium rhododendri]